MALTWYDLSEAAPGNGDTVYVRVKYYYGKPFLAVYSASTQGFTSIDTAQFYPNWSVARWAYQTTTPVATNVGVRLAASYAAIHNIDETNEYWINEYLPLFQAIFDPLYVDSNGAGYYYNTFKDEISCDFLMIFKGYVKGTTAYSYYDRMSELGCRWLNYSTAVVYNTTIPAGAWRSGNQFLIISSVSHFRYTIMPTGAVPIELSANQFLPTLATPLTSGNFGYNNTSDVTVLNSAISIAGFWAGTSAVCYAQHIKGVAVVDFNLMRYMFHRGVFARYCDFTSILLPDVFVGSTAGYVSSFYLSNNQLPTAEIDRLFADLLVKLTAMKAGYGIASNLIIDVSGNPGTLTGGVLNADYIGIVNLYAGSGYTVAITL
jgi:hypothetical protein